MVSFPSRRSPIARAHLAQSEPEVARDDLASRSAFCTASATRTRRRIPLLCGPFLPPALPGTFRANYLSSLPKLRDEARHRSGERQTNSAVVGRRAAILRNTRPNGQPGRELWSRWLQLGVNNCPFVTLNRRVVASFDFALGDWLSSKRSVLRRASSRGRRHRGRNEQIIGAE